MSSSFVEAQDKDQPKAARAKASMPKPSNHERQVLHMAQKSALGSEMSQKCEF